MGEMNEETAAKGKAIQILVAWRSVHATQGEGLKWLAEMGFDTRKVWVTVNQG